MGTFPIIRLVAICEALLGDSIINIIILIRPEASCEALVWLGELLNNILQVGRLTRPSSTSRLVTLYLHLCFGLYKKQQFLICISRYWLHTNIKKLISRSFASEIASII